jgi:hypothetical protein
VAIAQLNKSAPRLNKVEHRPNMKYLLEKLVALPACFNSTKHSFTNCSCINALDDFDLAAQELWKMAVMTKKEQEPPHNELINAHEATTVCSAQGYMF